MNNKALLILGSILIVLGICKPNLNFIDTNRNIVDRPVISEPTDSKLKDACLAVIDSFKNGDSNDAVRLASLYSDIATLIELDGEDLVVKTTDDIRYVNAISGPMLRMNIKSKYPKLASAAQAVIIAGIGDDNVPMDPALRKKAADSFRALSWACNEGSK